jgi:hypothetical protein
MTTTKGTPTMTTYQITYADGSPRTTHDSYDAACDALRADYPEAEIGHDGDLTSGGDRTLCWACEADSVDDDGARAVASIYRVEDD